MSCSRFAFSDDHLWDESVQTRTHGAVYGPVQQRDYPRQNWRLLVGNTEWVDPIGYWWLEVHIGAKTNSSLWFFEVQRERRTWGRYLELLQHASLWYWKAVWPADSVPLEGSLRPPHELVRLGFQHVLKGIVPVHQSARVQNLAIDRPRIWVPTYWKQNPEPYVRQLYSRLQCKETAIITYHLLRKNLKTKFL